MNVLKAHFQVLRLAMYLDRGTLPFGQMQSGGYFTVIVWDWLITAEQLTPVKGASTTANRSSMILNRYAYTDDVITVYTDMKTCSYWSAVPCQQQMDMHICMPQQLEIKDIPLQTKYNISLLNSVSDCANFINLTFNYISFLKEDKWTQEDEHITITGKHFKMHW